MLVVACNRWFYYSRLTSFIIHVADVEKLTKMKNLLDILSNPNKRMPLETLIKCEVVLEKLDFKRSEGVGLGLPPAGKVINNNNNK